VGVVGGVVSAALSAASAFAAAGQDPVVEITRILSAVPELAEVERDWTAAISRKFGPPAGKVSARCRATGEQNCHFCEDLDCGDNLRRQKVQP
jgi:hypothetical protein